MTKVRKVKRRKKFRANVNRKRLRNKLNKLPNIECKQIKEAWEKKRSIVKNMSTMGLAYDPNDVLKIPNVKDEMFKYVKMDGTADDESETEEVEKPIPKNIHVVHSLEQEARHPRAKLFRLPNNEVQFATYMMDKYGDDYRAMMKDRKNYNQLTWKQIRGKIERFKSIPEQYAEYLVQKGEIVLDDSKPIKGKKLKPELLIETAEKKSDSKSKRKRKKPNLLESVWQEELIAIDENQENKIDDESVEIQDEIHKYSGEKKLKLFPDEENHDVKKNEEDENDEDEGMSDNLSDNESDSDKNKNTKSQKSKQKNKRVR